MTLDQRDQKIEDLSVEVTRLRAQVATLEKQLAMAKAAQGHSHMYVRELPLLHSPQPSRGGFQLGESISHKMQPEPVIKHRMKPDGTMSRSSTFSLEGSSLQNKKPNKRKVLREG